MPFGKSRRSTKASNGENDKTFWDDALMTAVARGDPRKSGKLGQIFDTLHIRGTGWARDYADLQT